LGDWFFDTDAIAGRNIALCTAANTWTYLEATYATIDNTALTLPRITSYTVATLPTPSIAGRLAVVTDAASAGSCTSGGGTALALCRDSGSAWVPLGDGGSGGGGGGGGNTYISMPAANCQFGAGATSFSMRVADAPTPTCYEGTNVNLGVLQFADTATQVVQTMLRPEGTFTRIDLLGHWRTTATSGSVVWQVQTACAGDGDGTDPAWGTAQTIVDAAKAVANQLNQFSLTGVTACSAGQTMWVRFFRDPAHASDNLNATAELVGLTWVIVR
jgi:hypothetical protein